MAYTKPVTFADGSTLDAADLESCLSDLRDYINRGIVVGDITTDVLEARHLVRPEFLAFGSLFEMRCPTGAVFGLSQPAVGLTFDENDVNSTEDLHQWPMHFNECMAAPIHQTKSDDPDNYMPIPKTGRTFYLNATADCFIQWNIKLLAPYDNTAPTSTNVAPHENKCRLVIDSVDYPVTEFECLEHGTTAAGNIDSDSRVVSVCMMRQLTKGWHNLYLSCGLKSNFVFIGASQIIIEAEYT